jgi:hypothetical protein
MLTISIQVVATTLAAISISLKRLNNVNIDKAEGIHIGDNYGKNDPN